MIGTLPLEAQGDVASALDGEAGRLFGIVVTILRDAGKPRTRCRRSSSAPGPGGGRSATRWPDAPG
jgi:hypothetical protein